MLTIFKRSSGFNQDFQRWPVNLYFSLAIQQKALIFRKVLNHPEYLIYYCTPLENQATLCTNVKNLKILISFEFYIFFFPIKTSLFCHRQHNKHLIPTINTIIIKKKMCILPWRPMLRGFYSMQVFSILLFLYRCGAWGIRLLLVCFLLRLHLQKLAKKNSEAIENISLLSELCKFKDIIKFRVQSKKKRLDIPLCFLSSS